MDQATVMQLIAVQASKKKAENKESFPGVMAGEEEVSVPMIYCPEGQDNAADVLYVMRYLRPARVPPVQFWPLTSVKGWEPALPEHMKAELGTEGCIPPQTFLAMHDRRRKLEIKHFMEKNRGALNENKRFNVIELKFETISSFVQSPLKHQLHYISI